MVHNIKISLVLIAAICLCAVGLASEKHALIIAIGDYPTETTGWSKISSANDVPLIKDALLKQDFKENNIIILRDHHATKAGIEQALHALLKKIKPGDVVMIHYSGHGQQVLDDDGDEADGLDEALVPYNAMADTRGGYMGEDHFRDDDMEKIIAAFRNKLGKNGQLFILLDSCHSGSMTRGAAIVRGGRGPIVPTGWTPPQTRGKTKGSGLFQNNVKISDSAAPFVMISGASAHELNHEYNGNGSLSYAFAHVMNNLGKDYTYRQLFANIKAKMQVIAPRQNPVIEGDIDYSLFNNAYRYQAPYFEVKKIADPKTLWLTGGKLSNLFEGTTVLVMPQSEEKNEKNALAKGTVVQAEYTEAKVVLDTPLHNKTKADVWIYVDVPAFEEMHIKVAFDASANDDDIKKSVAQFLKENHLGNVVDVLAEADLIIGKNKNGYNFKTPTDAHAIENPVIASRGGVMKGIPREEDELNQRIFNFAQGLYLKNLDLKNPNYEFSFRFIPTDANPDTYQVNDPDQILKVVPDKDEVYLEITNKSRYDLYVSIVEINSQGEVSAIFPNDDCPLSDQDRLIKSQQTFVFKTCVYGFGDPYEKLTLKGFASPFPLNLRAIIQNKEAEVATRSGAPHPLERFVQQSYVKTRGARAQQNNAGVDGYSAEFIYEIVPHRVD